MVSGCWLVSEICVVCGGGLGGGPTVVLGGLGTGGPMVDVGGLGGAPMVAVGGLGGDPMDWASEVVLRLMDLGCVWGS